MDYCKVNFIMVAYEGLVLAVSFASRTYRREFLATTVVKNVMSNKRGNERRRRNELY